MIELRNIALASSGDSNLILLEQLQESGITYYINPNTIRLMRNKKTIAHARRNHILFILKPGIPDQVILVINRAMAIIERDQLTHFISLNKRICFWHWELAYLSNV